MHLFVLKVDICSLEFLTIQKYVEQIKNYPQVYQPNTIPN